jgi:hypothetical protein
MNPDPVAPRQGLYFSVSMQERMSLDELAPDVGHALGVRLAQSTERGTMGDYVGEILGVQLWLFIADPPTPGIGPRFALIGSPEHEFDQRANWIDVSSYVAELLTVRTGRPWTTGRP